MGRLRWAGGAVMVFAALGAPATQAATVSTTSFSGELELEADAGEANDVAISATQAGELATVRFTDAGAPLTAGDGCVEGEGSDAVTCEVEGLYIVFARIGDGDDSLDAGGMLPGDQLTANAGPGDDFVGGPPSDACVDGGSGDDRIVLRGSTMGCSIRGEGGADVLRGSGGRDNLFGGGGPDRVRGLGGPDGVDGGGGPDDVDAGDGVDSAGGGDGRDLVHGGPGDDFVSDDPGDDRLAGGAGDDVLDVAFFLADGDDMLVGGPGRDLASYFCPSCAVTLDGEANDGRFRRGERDDVDTEDVEVISHFFDDDEGELFTYGSGRDLIHGDSGANLLRGDRGEDVIAGRGGHDEIRAGKGGDHVNAADGARDAVDCGRGDDEVVADPVDDLVGCERVFRQAR